MKTKGNGGYQIIDFEGQAPNTLDVDLFGNAIARGKPLWVNNLVVDGETYNGVASIKKTLAHIILVIATIQIVIALSDGSTTYEESVTNPYEELTIVIEESKGNLQVTSFNDIEVSQDNFEVYLNSITKPILCHADITGTNFVGEYNGYITKCVVNNQPTYVMICYTITDDTTIVLGFDMSANVIEHKLEYNV